MSQPPPPPPFGPWVSDTAKAMFEAHVRGAAAPPGGVEVLRAHYRRFNDERLAVADTLFDTRQDHTAIAGVTVDIVRPADAAKDRSPRPVLICLHGGGFMWGDGSGALLEAVPVAAVSGIEVVAVDYRMAPEHRFPAATDDVLAVYRALRADPGVSAIGLFGCSAGAVLTAQVTARLIAEGEPLPDAICMLHAAGVEMAGDSAGTMALLNGVAPAESLGGLGGLPYFDGADANDPLVFPGNHPDVLAKFPPSLLITGTRDFAASAVTVMHRRLLAAGAQAELVVFDGMWHAHHVAVELPESAETFALMSRFFASRLT
ncbi:MAG: alpha/beta hydrolase fold protein [Caulobacter sp.]|nr:alpha/beta hydrolase fold protein [Caulobacter sp.]